MTPFEGPNGPTVPPGQFPDTAQYNFTQTDHVPPGYNFGAMNGGGEGTPDPVREMIRSRPGMANRSRLARLEAQKAKVGEEFLSGEITPREAEELQNRIDALISPLQEQMAASMQAEREAMRTQALEDAGLQAAIGNMQHKTTAENLQNHVAAIQNPETGREEFFYVPPDGSQPMPMFQGSGLTGAAGALQGLGTSQGRAAINPGQVYEQVDRSLPPLRQNATPQDHQARQAEVQRQFTQRMLLLTQFNQQPNQASQQSQGNQMPHLNPTHQFVNGQWESREAPQGPTASNPWATPAPGSTTNFAMGPNGQIVPVVPTPRQPMAPGNQQLAAGAAADVGQVAAAMGSAAMGTGGWAEVLGGLAPVQAGNQQAPTSPATPGQGAYSWAAPQVPQSEAMPSQQWFYSQARMSFPTHSQDGLTRLPPPTHQQITQRAQELQESFGQSRWNAQGVLLTQAPQFQFNPTHQGVGGSVGPNTPQQYGLTVPTAANGYRLDWNQERQQAAQTNFTRLVQGGNIQGAMLVGYASQLLRHYGSTANMPQTVRTQYQHALDQLEAQLRNLQPGQQGNAPPVAPAPAGNVAGINFPPQQPAQQPPSAIPPGGFQFTPGA